MRVRTLVLAALLLAACGQDTGQEATGDERGRTSEEDATAPQGRAEEEDTAMIEGTLGGDAQLEGGCAWLDTGDARYEVAYPEGYEIVFDPVRLVGPSGDTVATEGEVVAVRGRVGGDLMSVCQVGSVFEADEVVPRP